MKIKFIQLSAVFAIAVLTFQACKKSGSSPSSSTSFDRKGMLTNLSTNIIVPAYVTFQASAVNLDTAITSFNASPSLTKLTALQAAFKDTYQKWQAVSVFDFGPATNENLRISINTFPADTTQIGNNVTSGNTNLSALSSLPAQGLPALDFLLFGIGADNNTILTKYTIDSKAANRKAYLATVSTIIRTKATNVLNAWKTTYPATFINTSGTDVGSSLGQLTNELNEDYEVLKNYEVGIPLGIQSMGATFPGKVQAYYSKISLQLALLHLQAIQNIYQGKSAQGDGLGFDDYLIAVKAQYNGGSLNDAIIAEFAAATTKLQALSDPLSTEITTNPTAVNAAYTELQKLTVLLKTDMPSALGILITYGDTDGD